MWAICLSILGTNSPPRTKPTHNVIKKKSHFASACYIRNKSQLQRYPYHSRKCSDSQVINKARGVTNTITYDWPASKITVILHHLITNDHIGSFEATPDTGTEAMLAGIEIFQKMCLGIDTLLLPPSEVLVADKGEELDSVSTLRCVIQYCDRQCLENEYICSNIESFSFA